MKTSKIWILAAVAQEYNLRVIVDETYRHFVFDGQAQENAHTVQDSEPVEDSLPGRAASSRGSPSRSIPLAYLLATRTSPALLPPQWAAHPG